MTTATGAVLYVNLIGGLGRAGAEPLATGLSDPAQQPLFATPVPNALAPSFKYKDRKANGGPAQRPNFSIRASQTMQQTGLVNPRNGRPLKTKVWGYGADTVSWPGMTFEVIRGEDDTVVRWENDLGKRHLLSVDESLHWAYSLADYEQYSIKRDGVPMVVHLHGGHTDFQYDGNPEFFYSPDGEIRGPQWDAVPGGFTNTFRYDNDVPAGTLWYHDHALGITRLNVYAGLAGFYIVRDSDDTGKIGNPLHLPAFPYEAALAIQDRMFTDKGDLFYPAFPGDPLYDDFITGEGAILPPDIFPGGGPTALAEFFGDHMVVNGKIWPNMEVEPRNYRLRLLNGCDSRFLVSQFFEVPAGATDLSHVRSGPLDFTVIGGDQGLASSPTTVDTLLMETGSRYDIIFDFKTVTPGNRVIMKNIGGDEPFGGDIPGPVVYDATDRIMAFDVTLPFDAAVHDVTPTRINFGPVIPAPTRLRKVALFEGKDEFGRLQPLLGTAEPATDWDTNSIDWPDTPVYSSVGLTGQMEGSIAWHSPTTENPALGSTEEWEIWNMTGDAHPVHLHLVNFEILGRKEIMWDSATTEDDRVLDPNDATSGTYLVTQPTVQHNSVAGSAVPSSGCNRP
ncbi:MAG: multicopper oxidase domain-containing protein, partial [Acidimicrobiia bacterium]|nr:multicopper oxidase domain-containing protein [Acidimicrobiia bacterium]